MTVRCDLTDLLATDCAHCRKLPDLDTTPTNRTRSDGTAGPQIEARYPGNCAGCGDTFHAGQAIRADGAGGWLADRCADL